MCLKVFWIFKIKPKSLNHPYPRRVPLHIHFYFDARNCFHSLFCFDGFFVSWPFTQKIHGSKNHFSKTENAFSHTRLWDNTRILKTRIEKCRFRHFQNSSIDIAWRNDHYIHIQYCQITPYIVLFFCFCHFLSKKT